VPIAPQHTDALSLAAIAITRFAPPADRFHRRVSRQIRMCQRQFRGSPGGARSTNPEVARISA
jgi:hypothetical protein